MAENQYRRYLEGEEQKKDGSVLPEVGAGLAFGSALLTSRGRSAIRETAGAAGRIAGTGLLRTASYLKQQNRVGGVLGSAMGYLKALDHGLDGRSPVAHFLNPDRLDRRFNESIARQTQQLERKGQSLMGGTPTRIEESYSQMLSDLPMSSRVYRRSVQRQLAMNEMQAKLPKHFDQGLETILNQQRGDFFLDPNKGRIENLLDRYHPSKKEVNNNAFSIDIPLTDKKSREDFVNQMFTTLEKYKNTNKIDKKVLNRGGTIDGVEIQGAKNMAKTIKEGFMQDNEVKNTMLSKMMQGLGYKPAKVSDFLEHDGEKWVNKLFDNDAIIRQNKEAKSQNARIGEKLASMANKDERFLNLGVDERVFVNDQGHMMDTRGMHRAAFNTGAFFQRNFQVPFLRFNPLDLAHWTTYEAIKEAPKTYFMRRGTITPGLGNNVETTAHPRAHNQDAAIGALGKDYMYSGNKVFDVVSGKQVDQDVYLGSGRFGMIPRAMASIANLHTPDNRRAGFLKRLFDVGQQETDHLWQRMGSTVTKFNDPNWARNRYKKIFSEDMLTDESILEVEASYKDLYSEINSRSKSLSYDTSHYLNQHVKKAYGASDIDLTKLNTPEEVMTALGRIQKGMEEKNHRLVTNSLSVEIGKNWSDYQKNPAEFLKGKRIVSDHAPYMIGPLQAVDAHEVALVSKIDDVKRLIHQHAIDQLEQREKISVGDLIKQGIEAGHLADDSLSEVKDLSILNRMHSYWKEVYLDGPNSKLEALHDFQSDLLTNNGNNPFNTNLKQVVEQHSPIWAMGPGDKPPQHFGFVAYTPVHKARGAQWALGQYNEMLAEGVSPLKAGVKSALDVIKQPFAGRKNMSDFTTASMIGFYAAERLDNTLAKVGLGLSQKNRGSMQSILANQFGRRVVLPYMAVQQAMWLDDQTGDFFSDKAADTYANMTMDVGWFKETLGLNNAGKQASEVFAGMDQFWKTPVGGLMKYGTFGFLGDTRSDEDLQQYYESGEDPIRKGRWWGVGSTTPWEGGKIDRYIPNWYRRLKSDYKYTDTMYGTESEYWRNHWMPTLTNPLAPIRHFFTDPGHYENKHAEDRPYPITGGIQELGMVPVVGPLLNRTIGGVLNPYREHKDLSKAHKDYLAEVNSYIESQYNSSIGGGMLQFMPAGGYNMMSESTSFGGGFGEGLSALITPGNIAAGIGGGGNGSDQVKSQLGALNAGIAGAAGTGTGPSGGMMMPSRPLNTLESLRDPEAISDLQDIASPFSSRNVGQDLWYNVTELAGIYGFSANMLAGIDTNVRTNALDRSSRMMSYSRSYWDMELGGFDGPFSGEFSEIFRRYVARDPRKEYYNPLKNKMPDWLPGVNYFVDFQHGDPYTKVAKGEMRLPGAAYESLNELHPDAFGEYGAFDRFKILADVAPYSDEYRYWRKTVSQMKQQNMLTPEMDAEYKEVRDQVSEKKKKYHFYPNKFRNAEIQKETVTVTQMLDPTTFLTAEHPNNPIRLAGVDIKADATEAQEWLSQYVYEGAKVTIGVDADPLFRVRDDTMNTMHAVVYSNGEDQNPWYMSTKGQTVNSMLARRKFKDPDGVTVKPENSAVGTAAMFDSADITVGKISEWVTHDLMPNIPILGTITDKFWPVRSPLEMYKKNEVYGKAWRPWTDPWGGWVQPMLETAASKNPLVAAAQGYGLGWMTGKAGMGKYYGKWIGAAVFGTLASIRTINEYLGENGPDGDKYAWIPKRRETEREINEYFDVLKYMKYKGLYEKASQEAERYEGVNIDEMLSENDSRGKKNKQLRRYLDTSKKWLSIAKKSGYVDEEQISEQLDKVNSRLGEVDANRPSMQIGSRTMQALQYKAQYESTLYGADANGDMTKIFRALPNKDREYFTEFMTAAPKEREEILRLVPKNQRRFYQAKWGMEPDKKEALSSYFRNKYLPGENWEGWNANVDLEDIKLKVVRNEALELTEFGMWADDVSKAEQSGVESISPFKPSMSIDIGRIEKILRGAGVEDATVTMSTAPAKGENRIEVGINYVKDRMDEIKTELSNNLGSIFG